MARGSRPGRLLAVAGLVLAVLYGLVALGGEWTPRPGVETGGGTRLVVPVTDAGAADLARARDVLAERLDDAGVPAARVRTAADGLVVEVPPRTPRSVLDSVVRPAELSVRVVARSGFPAAAEPTASPSASPSASTSASPSAESSADPSADPSAGPSTEPSAGPSTEPSASPTPLDGGELVDDPVAWAARPDVASGEAFDAARCPTRGAPGEDDLDRPVVACDANGLAYLLSAAVVDGSAVDGVEAVLPTGRTTWGLALDLDGDGTRAFGAMTQRLEGTGRQFALVVDGQVVAAPQTSAVTDGRPQISADLTEAEAEALAASLRSGSLPVALAGEPESTTVPASLPAGALGTGVLVGGLLALVATFAAVVRLGVLGLLVPAALLTGTALTHAGLLLLARGLDLALTPAAWAALPLGPALAAGSAALLLALARTERAAGASAGAAVDTATRRTQRLALAGDAVVAAAGLALLVLGRGDALDGVGVLLLLAAAVGLLTRVGVVAPLVELLVARPATRSSAPAGERALAARPRERVGALAVLGVAALATLGLLVRPLDAGVDLAGGRLGGPGAALGAVGATWDATDTRWLVAACAVLVLVVLGALAGWAGRRQVVPAALVPPALAVATALGLAAWTGVAVGAATVAAVVLVGVVALAAGAVVLGAVTGRGPQGAARARTTRRQAAELAAAPAAAWPTTVAAVVAVPALAVLVAALVADGGSGEVAPASLALAGGTVLAAAATVLLAVPALVALDERDPAIREADRRVLARRRHDSEAPRPSAGTAKSAKSAKSAKRSGASTASGGSGAVRPAPARGPVARSASAGRQQPTRKTRAKRGKK
ncbi:SecDF P1 head subdomain-containing protein [Nocardioides perillae]|uniref:Preprotein translocase subunit SecD n=1 Tax=Nocardioides perillae TaxID=1119534 RepID=A0A7Y9UMH1_9ACTN|nr:hypothetical protein [Nocardioides perillae]NYG56097.1 preprotein translocase subunit SecD [Nocardioides perillae]